MHIFYYYYVSIVLHSISEKNSIEEITQLVRNIRMNVINEFHRSDYDSFQCLKWKGDVKPNIKVDHQILNSTKNHFAFRKCLLFSSKNSIFEMIVITQQLKLEKVTPIVACSLHL